MKHEDMQHSQAQHGKHYKHLLFMMALSFIAMYILMYAMVDGLAEVYPNFNQFYMAGLMASPMLVIELAFMGSMYPDKKLNKLLMGAGVALGLLFFILIRQQAAINDEQFLKSMIPHHSGAILMCEKASLQQAAIKDLCDTIVKGQRAEIEQMKGLLAK